MVPPERDQTVTGESRILLFPVLVEAYPGLNVLQPMKEQPHSSSNVRWLNISVSLDSPEQYRSPPLLPPPFYTTDKSLSLGPLYVSWGSFPNGEIPDGQFNEAGDIL